MELNRIYNRLQISHFHRERDLVFTPILKFWPNFGFLAKNLATFQISSDFLTNLNNFSKFLFTPEKSLYFDGGTSKSCMLKHLTNFYFHFLKSIAMDLVLLESNEWIIDFYLLKEFLFLSKFILVRLDRSDLSMYLLQL